MKNILMISLVVCGLTAFAQDKPLYKNDFEKAEAGKVPEELMVLGGEFVVKPENIGKPGMNELAPVWHLQQNLERIKGRQAIFIGVSPEDMNYQPTLKLTAVLDELGVPYEKSFPPGIKQNLNQYWAACGRPLTTWLHAQLAPAK